MPKKPNYFYVTSESNLAIRDRIKTHKVFKAFELMILLIALFSSSILVMEKTNFLFPSADEEIIPMNIRVSNITDSTFAVSFVTNQPVVSFLNYSDQENNLLLKEYDTRNLINKLPLLTHHILLKDLKPNTTYYYTIGFQIGSGLTVVNKVFNYQNRPFNFITASIAKNEPTIKTVYGKIFVADKPAKDYLVYFSLPGSITASGVVNEKGEWNINLNKIMKNDLSDFTIYSETDLFNLNIQSTNVAENKSITATIADAQPLIDIFFDRDEQQNIEEEVIATVKVVEPIPVAQEVIATFSSQLIITPTPIVEIEDTEGQFAQILNPNATSKTNISTEFENTPYSTDYPVLATSPTSKPNITPTIQPTLIPTQIIQNPAVTIVPTQAVIAPTQKPTINIQPTVSQIPAPKIITPNNPTPTPQSGNITITFLLTIIGLVMVAIGFFYYFAKEENSI